MKPKQPSDQQKVSDLLKKLQASYLGSDSKSAEKKKRKDAADEDDRKFQEKLASMLGKSANTSSPPTPAQPVEESHEKSEETKTLSALSEPTIPEAKSVTEVPTEKEEPRKNKKQPSASKKQASSKKAKPENSVLKKEKEESSQSTSVSEAEIVSAAPEPIAKQEALPTEEPAISEVKPSTEESHSHPLDKVIPLTSVEGPVSSPKPKPIQANIIIPESNTPRQNAIISKKQSESSTGNAQSSAPQKVEESPKSVQADKNDSPAVMLPPPSVAPDFSKSKSQKSQSEPIVIRPRVPAAKAAQSEMREQTITIRPPVQKQTASESIVIKPRTSGKNSTAVPQLIRKEETAPPIKIGKEAASDPQKDNKPNPIMKEEQKTTLIPPTPVETEPSKKAEMPTPEPQSSVSLKKPGITLPRSPAASVQKGKTKKHAAASQESPTVSKSESKRAGVTLPRTGERKSASANTTGERVTKKKVRQNSEQNLAAKVPENENLEEALEDDIIEEIPMDAPEEISAPPQKMSAFRRRQQEKQKQAEENLSALEVIRKKSGLTEDDIAMMFELGYENELGRLVGYENLKRLKSEHLKQNSSSDKKIYRTAFGYRGEEYAGSEQNVSVSAAYVHDRKQLAIRAVLTALLTLILFFVDTPSLIGERLLAIDSAYPLLLPILGMVLLAISTALSYRQINAGLRSFLKFSSTPYTICALLTPTALLYDIASMFSISPMLQVNFLTSLTLLGTVFCDVLRLSCETRTLRIVAADSPKIVLAPATPRKKKLRRGNKIVKIINDDVGENLYQVRKSHETTGFFRRFNNMKSTVRPVTAMIITMYSLAVLVGIMKAVVTSDASAALSSFMTTLMITTPLSVLFTFFYPLCRANRLLAHRNCALIGDEAVEEYNEKKTVIFRDKDLYSAEKNTEIAVREGDDFKNDLRLAGILFRKLGGALKPIGGNAPGKDEELPVSIVRIQEKGVEAIVDNRYHLLAGHADFLKHSGVRVPKESTDKILRRTANVSLMYVAIDGVLKLSYEIEYTAKKSFENVVRDLADSDTAVAINSYDPNLHETFLLKSRPDGTEPIQVIKPGRFEEDKPLEITDTGVVALGARTDIAYPLHAATNIGNIRRFGYRIQFIASLIGGLAMIILTLLGENTLLSVLAIAAYQLFWVLVTLITSHTELNANKLRFRRQEKTKDKEI